MAPHTVGAIDGNVMDQRTVSTGRSLNTIHSHDDGAHVLAAVLVPAGKRTIERVNNDPDDWQAPSFLECSGGGDDPVCIEAAGAQVDHLRDDRERDVRQAVMLTPRKHSTLDHRAPFYGNVEHGSSSHPPFAIFEARRHMAAGIERNG